VSRLPNQAQAF